MWISEWRWRITCRYRSRDQSNNFRTFKMAVGRHFENSFISISQPWIIRFWSNFVCRYKFPFREWSSDKRSNFCKFKMADARNAVSLWVWVCTRPHYFYCPSPDFTTSIVSQSVTNNRRAPSCGGHKRKVRGHYRYATEHVIIFFSSNRLISPANTFKFVYIFATYRT